MTSLRHSDTQQHPRANGVPIGVVKNGRSQQQQSTVCEDRKINTIYLHFYLINVGSLISLISFVYVFD